MDTMTNKRERIKLTPEQTYNVYLECSIANAPVKQILERNGLKAWDMVAIRKKVKEAALEALSGTATRGRKMSAVPLTQYQSVCRQLEETKDALATIGYELSLLKKRVNSV